ncbi:MAG: biopolymer transporter ExbD [Treponema sp.]|nr:biopolymer transporter ExbD [Treponema sp.]
MKLHRPPRKDFFIPLSSMSDVAFLLLVFIMLVSLINYRREVKIEYPEARRVSRTSAEKNLEIWIDREGQVYVNGLASDLEEIQNAVDEIYRNAPDTRLHIIADRNTPYRHLNAVISVLQLLQYRVVSFVVKDSRE